MKVIKKEITPDGTGIQIEDWSKEYSFHKENDILAFYPKATESIYRNMEDNSPYPKRGQTFRASLKFENAEESESAFNKLLNGQDFIDYLDFFESNVVSKENFLIAVGRRYVNEKI